MSGPGTSTSRVLITGGGTAGHTNPGIAIAQALVASGLDPSEIHFVGAERGNEARLVPEAGFDISVLPGRGIQRTLSPSGIADNIGAISGLVRALVRGRSILRDRKPSAVVCLGGYAAFATSVAALLHRTPLIVSEQNARASAVNRLLGRFATVCALPYPDTDLPSGVLTGNPVLAPVVDAIISQNKTAARAELGLPADRTVLAIWSGSLGAGSVNKVAASLAEHYRDRGDLAIHHVVGRRDWHHYRHLSDAFRDRALHYQGVEYEDRMADLLVAADVALTRSGASTTAELAVAGLPAVMVPLPGAPRDHQQANAQELVRVGGGFCIPDEQLTPARVRELIDPLLEQESKRSAMAEAARSVGRPNAAAAVAALVLEAGMIEVGR